VGHAGVAPVQDEVSAREHKDLAVVETIVLDGFREARDHGDHQPPIDRTRRSRSANSAETRAAAG
jgi:hypothetical protein